MRTLTLGNHELLWRRDARRTLIHKVNYNHASIGTTSYVLTLRICACVCVCACALSIWVVAMPIVFEKSSCGGPTRERQPRFFHSTQSSHVGRANQSSTELRPPNFSLVNSVTSRERDASRRCGAELKIPTSLHLYASQKYP